MLVMREEVLSGEWEWGEVDEADAENWARMWSQLHTGFCLIPRRTLEHKSHHVFGPTSRQGGGPSCLCVSQSFISGPQGEEGGCNLLIKMAPLHWGTAPGGAGVWEWGKGWLSHSEPPPTGAVDRMPLALRRGSRQGISCIHYTKYSLCSTHCIENEALEQKLKNYKSKTHLDTLLTNICHLKGRVWAFESNRLFLSSSSAIVTW